MTTKVAAAMAAADMATQAELDAAIAAEVTARNSAIATAQVGSVVQAVNTTVAASATTTTVLPGDDTIPQITEGGEFMTLAYTPLSATNKLRVDVVLNLAGSVSGYLTGALFVDATAGALGAGVTYCAAANAPGQVHFTVWLTAGSTTARTYRVRGGLNSAGTTTFNGAAGTRLLGGAMASSITVTEIKA